MSLQQFFDAMEPFLQGRSELADVEAALGPAPGDPNNHRFYPWLVAFDQRRILAELFAAAHALVARTEGIEWGELVVAYLVDHPSIGHAVPELGTHFAQWLAQRREAHPEQPEALECLADLRWTRFIAFTAADVPGVGMDVRLFMRHYPLDVLALERALVHTPDPQVPLPAAGSPRTLLIYRHAEGTAVKTRIPSMATLAVLAQLQGMALAGPLAELGDDVLQAELVQLEKAGVVPRS